MTTSQPSGDPGVAAHIKEALRIEEDSLYSSKGHFEAARGWANWHYGIGIPSVILSAIAGISAVKDCTALTVTVTLLTAVGTSLLTFLDPKATSSAHHRFGTAYKALLTDARMFREIDCTRVTLRIDADTELKKLRERSNALNNDAPQIPRSAFKRARQGIEAGEAAYEADRKDVQRVEA